MAPLACKDRKLTRETLAGCNGRLFDRRFFTVRMASFCPNHRPSRVESCQPTMNPEDKASANSWQRHCNLQRKRKNQTKEAQLPTWVRDHRSRRLLRYVDLLFAAANVLRWGDDRATYWNTAIATLRFPHGFVFPLETYCIFFSAGKAQEKAGHQDGKAHLLLLSRHENAPR